MDTRKIILVIFNATLLAIGNCGGPLIIRLYFLRGGKRVWFSTWLQTAAWPLILIPHTISYLRRRRKTTSDRFFRIPPFLATAGVCIGGVMGMVNYLYTYGIAKLPVSTSTLIVSSQLAFTAFFAFLLVKQKFTAFSVNAVVLLTVGAAVLGLHAGSDRPAGESNKEYVMGFVLTVLAAALYGLVMPLVEFCYAKTSSSFNEGKMGYGLVLEYQMVSSLSSTLVCTVGMLINHDFQAIPREAREFELGEVKYYIIVVCSGIIWQLFYIGSLGVIYHGSSLLSVVIITFLLPVTELLAVVFYHEKFQSEKGVSLFLSLWGFVSYFYREIKKMHKNKKQLNSQTPKLEDEIITPSIIASPPRGLI